MPELIDICDHEGHLTGQALARSEAHQQELWHRVVLVWVVNGKGELLMQQRADHLNSFPGLWDVSVDGHISSGEEPTPAAIRELQEELGIEVVASDLQFADTVEDHYAMTYGKMHQEFDFIFVVHRDMSADDLKLQAAEVSDVRWVSADDLEQELKDSPAKFSARNPEVYRLGLAAARNQAKAPQA